MIKVCVYLNDVDDQTGPYEVLSPEANTALLNLQRGRYRYRIYPSEFVAHIVGGDSSRWCRSLTGPAGTVIFSDTATYYHRGKPPSRTNRIAIFFQYFARPPRHPFLCERSPLSRQDIRQLAEGLSPTQRAATLWRDHVPPSWPGCPRTR